jgi:predicted Zn-dependent protease with MMP-like domain
MQVSREEFEQLVSQALADLPAEFAEKLENVEVMVEDYPSEGYWPGRERPPGAILLGIYQGVPLTRRSHWMPYQFPDRIVVFQRTIESVCRNREEIITQVRRTVLHEVAHHFGISDRRLRELGC